MSEIDSKQPGMRWQSLEELAGTPEFQKFIDTEFPQGAAVSRFGVDRREFLTLIAASMGLAGLTACTPTDSEKIVPYSKPPEEFLPGKPLFFATAMPLAGYGTGLLAESHLGRPTKVEGNPLHPASLGATDAFAQASVLSLYDPDRSQTVKSGGQPSTWEAFAEALAKEMESKKSSRGKGLRILTETVTSPVLFSQIQQLLRLYPAAAWHQYEPTAPDPARAASKAIFGNYVDARFDFTKASVIVSLDADFLGWTPGHLRYSRDFAARRRPEGSSGTASDMNRLYVMESTPTITGASADHRFAIRSSDIPSVAKVLADIVGGRKAQTPAIDTSKIEAIARDLAAHRGSSLVVAGTGQPQEVHILAHEINAALGNIGSTVTYMPTTEQQPVEHGESLKTLLHDVASGGVDLLVIIGGNPAYTAPADLEFAAQLARVRTSIHLSMFEEETSALCAWHIPEAHYLESWGDIRAFDGTTTIIQPLIDPLYGGKTAAELLSVILGEPKRTSYSILRNYWQHAHGGTDFDKFWRKALHDGIVPEITAPSPLKLPTPSGASPAVSGIPAGLELVFRTDPSIFDGRFANNSWLQELPKPLSKITWDNVIQLSPATAGQLGIANEDVVEVRYNNRSITGPAFLTAGQADNSITVFLGYGRTSAANLAKSRGYNAYAIRTSSAPWVAHGVEVRKTGGRYRLASTQHHHAMEDRHTVRTTTQNQIPSLQHAEALPSLYPEVPKDNYAWGMNIDLSACNGCNACVVACQSENNIPVVGKSEIMNAREMHWIRIDRYYDGNAADPDILFQPMMCQHCENAPCEPVCPVGATSHSSEGINEMTYNRCVGTRYCSNNCPYKVRRFNFYQYAITEVPALQMLNNPDVTVRSRGVMEKCTYCVQRVNTARIHAKNEDRAIRDGEVVSACQAVCPANAIVFGNINDPESRVSKLRASARNYGVLEELNTRPRTTYLMKVTNPNPELVKKA